MTSVVLGAIWVVFWVVSFIPRHCTSRDSDDSEMTINISGSPPPTTSITSHQVSVSPPTDSAYPPRAQGMKNCPLASSAAGDVAQYNCVNAPYEAGYSRRRYIVPLAPATPREKQRCIQRQQPATRACGVTDPCRGSPG